MTAAKIGAVLIGRNEGDRLRACIDSVLPNVTAVVYVDSGSTDNSVTMARGAGCNVVQLDMSTPFTAARARNEGYRRLRQLVPELTYVQFVDGDCEVVSGWLDEAATFLEANPKVAAVCGRRRERYPARSIYNFLCDLEWNTPIGEAKACGGDAMMRVSAFDQVGGFRNDLIAGEEPELCVRLRAAAWKIWRLDEEMTLHDAAMTRFSQWWRRTMRSGYSSANGAYLHGDPPEFHRVWEMRRAWVWGLWLPLACLVVSVAFPPWGLAAWLIYPLQVLRQIARNTGSVHDRSLLALFQVMARFPEACGQLKFIYNRWFDRQAQLIEYK